MREERHGISHILAHRESVYSIKKKGNAEKDRGRLFTGLTLMPCGLYIWLAARLSLYPPVWLITWRRVSTWNGGGHADKRNGQTKAGDNKASHA